MINCNVIQDLIPLVNDGIASVESRALVCEHCEKCHECKEVLDMEQGVRREFTPPNDARILKNIKRRLTYSKVLYSGLGILFALLVWGLWGKLSGNIMGNEMAFALIIFYFVIPLTAFVITLILSIKGSFWKWIFPLIAYAFTLAISFIMFHHSGDSFSAIISLVPALLGLGIGLLVRSTRNRRNGK